MEILDLYDKDRIRTGKTYLRGTKQEEGLYRLIVHLAIFNSDYKLLAQQRVDNKKQGGKWDISVGGACQSGEDSSIGISRELEEELGIKIDFTDLRAALTVNFNHGFDDFYILKKDIDIKDLTLQKSEVKDARYLSEKEVFDLMDRGEFFPYKKTFIKLLFELAKDDRVVEI